VSGVGDCGSGPALSKGVPMESEHADPQPTATHSGALLAAKGREVPGNAGQAAAWERNPVASWEAGFAPT